MESDEIAALLDICGRWLETGYNQQLESNGRNTQRKVQNLDESRFVKVQLEYMRQFVTVNQFSLPTNTVTCKEIITYTRDETANAFHRDDLRNTVMDDKTAISELVMQLVEDIPVMSDLEDIIVVPLEALPDIPTFGPAMPTTTYPSEASSNRSVPPAMFPVLAPTLLSSTTPPQRCLYPSTLMSHLPPPLQSWRQKATFQRLFLPCSR